MDLLVKPRLDFDDHADPVVLQHGVHGGLDGEEVPATAGVHNHAAVAGGPGPMRAASVRVVARDGASVAEGEEGRAVDSRRQWHAGRRNQTQKTTNQEETAAENSHQKGIKIHTQRERESIYKYECIEKYQRKGYNIPVGILIAVGGVILFEERERDAGEELENSCSGVCVYIP